MARTRAGQYQLEFNIEGFTSPNRAHALRAYVQPQSPPSAGTPASSIALQARGGGTVNADAAANAFWEFIRLFYPSNITSSQFTLWRFATNNIREFVTAAPLTNPAGNGAQIVAMQQQTLTWRTALGGYIKLVLLEANQLGNTTLPLSSNAAGTPAQRLSAHLMSNAGVIIGIDNSFPIAPLRDSRGQNEYWFRELNR